MIRYKDANGAWKCAPAARSANGRIRPGCAVIGGAPTQVVAFQYQVRYYQNRKVQYESDVGDPTNARKAETLRRRLEQQTSAKAEAKKAGIEVVEPESRLTLNQSAKDYIADAEGRGAGETASQARHVSDELQGVVKRTFVDEVTRADILRFRAALTKRGCGDRTVANKEARLRSWLRFAGMDTDLFPPKPKYEWRC
jgi:hypothetical protein